MDSECLTAWSHPNPVSSARLNGAIASVVGSWPRICPHLLIVFVFVAFCGWSLRVAKRTSQSVAEWAEYEDVQRCPQLFTDSEELTAQS